MKIIKVLFFNIIELNVRCNPMRVFHCLSSRLDLVHHPMLQSIPSSFIVQKYLLFKLKPLKGEYS